jgi:hypothetical protein
VQAARSFYKNEQLKSEVSLCGNYLKWPEKLPVLDTFKYVDSKNAHAFIQKNVNL